MKEKNMTNMDYEKALEREPQNINYMRQYTMFLLKTKNYKKAEELLLKLLELDPNDEVARTNYSRLKIRTSKYSQHIQALTPMIKGKVVQNSIAGNSGFILIFTDNTSVISYLKKEKLYYKYIETVLSDGDRALIKSDDYGDGFAPLDVDIPYANVICNLASEISNAHGKTITGFSTGEDSFNFCFPNGMELETMLVPDKDNRIALRVFWEQW